MQRDPLGYVDGMNLYEFVGGRAIWKVDPFGLQTIGSKIFERIFRRFVLGTAVPNKVNRLFYFNDDEDELPRAPEIRQQMNKFYDSHFRTNGKRLPENVWQDVTILYQDAKKRVRPWRMEQRFLFDTGFWLNGAHSVMVKGNMQVCRNENVFHVRNLDMQWEWWDEIDAKTWSKLREDGHSIIASFAEGVLWHYVMDGFLDMEFHICVKFSDTADYATFPPGIKR
jgi:hypothetical protein